MKRKRKQKEKIINQSLILTLIASKKIFTGTTKQTISVASSALQFETESRHYQDQKFMIKPRVIRMCLEEEKDIKGQLKEMQDRQ